jgi:tetratricopeptide (TPR) repeat protein
MNLMQIVRVARISGYLLVASLGPAAANTVSDLVPDDLPSSLSGSYLAARSADTAHDISAALDYFDKAVELDPDNPVLLERLLTLRLANGDIEEAARVADRLVLADNGSPLGRLTLAVKAIGEKKYGDAQAEFDKSDKAPLANLTAGLIGAWGKYASGDVNGALSQIDGLVGPNWYQIFKDYHHALIADAAGRKDDALATIASAYQADTSALRVVEAYARINARAGKRDEAIRAVVAFAGEEPEHPVMKTLLSDIRAGKIDGPLIKDASEGAAEVLYGLGSAIGIDDGAELPQGYLQLALFLKPKDPLIVLGLGDLFQAVHNCDKAIALYGLVPAGSPFSRNSEIQTGNCLDSQDKADEAAMHMRRVVDANPSDIDAVIALGNLYRSHDRFTEAADAYSLGIATITDPDKADWRIYYYRGVALERSKRWPEAERDFQQSLKISPDQPSVLNYLGYSWVDMGHNLDQALDMIRKAVGLRPEDGYIVDSLGWAYYRLGRYPEAVEQLERAIELKPADSTINDHLGDAYWKVGRKLEAKFQWNHARDLGPEKDALPAILEKIKNGLKDDPPKKVAENHSGQATASDASPVTVAAADAKDGTPAEASTVTVRPGETLSTIAARIYGNPDDYTLIFEANRQRISDPNRIFPGMTLTIPAKGPQQ